METVTYIIALGTVGGFLIGGLTGFIIGRRKNRKTRGTSEEGVGEGSETGQVSPSLMKMLESDGLKPLLSIWRQPEKNRLVFEIKGRLYRDSSQLPVTSIKKLEQIGREWMMWLGIREEEPETPKPLAAEPVVLPASVEPSPMMEIRPPARPIHHEKLETATLKTPDLIRLDVKPSRKPISIADEIDAILQAKLTGSPLMSRGIRIAEDLDKSVVFWIGLNKYKNIDEIRDPEIVTRIRAAVAEWDQQTNAIHHH